MQESSRPVLRACLLGAGRAGGSLAMAWQAAGALRFVAVLARSGQSEVASQLDCAVHSSIQALPEADVWVIAVPDDAIAAVASALAQSASLRAPGVAFHLSGALSSEALEPLRQRHLAVASGHPVRAFPAVDSALDFATSRCAIEGDPSAVERVTRLFEAIGGQCFFIDSHFKTAYHCAAVLASNGLVDLADTALSSWQAAGVPADLARELFTDLVADAADNVVQNGTRASVTGPLGRGDHAVVAAQIADLVAR
ncbi:MAG: DUF2520 domain-containing protein, partial [Pseudomonadota bacterium]